MSQLQTRIDDEQVLSLQLQKKIKELQVKTPGPCPSSTQSCLQVTSLLSPILYFPLVSLCAGLSFSSFFSLLQQHTSF